MQPIVRRLVFLALVTCGGERLRVADSAMPSTPPRPATGLEPEALCAVEVTCYGSILDEPKAPCAMVITDATGGTVYDDAAGLELRGRSSMHFPKPQYGVELRTHTQLEVWPGATWRYLDDGSDPGPGWFEAGFDDAAWPEGRAPLGYGTDYLATTITPSTTAYFRYVFDVEDASAGASVVLGLLRTDGVVVWLNGVDIVRDGVPPGATADTWGTSTNPWDRWIEADLDPSWLIDGTNVMAVEIHQTQGAPGDLRFNLWLETSTEQAVDLFGMGADGDWILNGQYVDRALVRNRLAYDLFQSFGGSDRYATESRFCTLTLNGAPQGIYTLGERIEPGPDRLAIHDDAFLVKLDEEDGIHPNGIGRGTWQLVVPKDPDSSELAAVVDVLAGWEAATTGPDPADPEDGIFAYLDLASTVDWVLLQELMKNIDAYQLSVHLWKEPDGKMHFTPWDFDLSLGYPVSDCGFEGWVSRAYWDGTQMRPSVWIQAIAEVPAFRTALVDRWRTLRAGPLAEEAILARMDAYQATLGPGLTENLALWPIEEIAFFAGGDEDELCPVSSYEEERARTVAFLQGRLAWMDAHIESF